MIDASTTGLVLMHGKDDPPVFYGPPAALRGKLRLSNPTGEKLKLQQIPLAARKNAGVTLAGIARQPVASLEVAARIAPGAQGAAPATVRLDPRTAPGTYEAEITVGDRTQRVVLHVVDNLDLRISPDVVWLFTEGERKFTRRFVVENAGNVPVRLGERCAAMLVDVIEERAALREGSARACEDPESDPLRELLCAYSHQQAGLVLLDRPDETLQPGETRAGEATITLPEGLQSHRRYQARLELYNAAVVLEVTTGKIAEGGPR